MSKKKKKKKKITSLNSKFLSKKMLQMVNLENFKVRFSDVAQRRIAEALKILHTPNRGEAIDVPLIEVWADIAGVF